MGAGLAAELEETNGELSANLRKMVGEASSIRDRLVWATRLARPEWGIEYDRGLDTRLPHLAPLLQLGRLLRADAAQAAEGGDFDRAAEDIAALVRMSRHVGGKDIMSLQAAYALLAWGSLVAVEHGGGFTEAQRSVALRELRRIDLADPFGTDRVIAWQEDLNARMGLEPLDPERVRGFKGALVEDVREAVRTLE